MLYKPQRWFFFGLALLLAACAAPTNSAQPAAGETPAEAAAADADGVITLTVWDFGGVDFEWMDTLAIPKFQELHPNIKIEHLGVPESELGIKLETAIAANEVPDLAVFVPNRLMKAGHIVALNDLMDRDGFKVEEFCPLLRSRSMIEDKVYSLPMNVSVWAMVYNKGLFKAAGLPELSAEKVITFDDWLSYARAINKSGASIEERVWGSVHFVPNWNAMNNYMSDPYVLGADGRTCVGNADTEAWIHTWDVMATAYREELTVDTSAAMIGETGFEDLFKQGKLGMIYGTAGTAQAMREAGLEVGLTGQPVVNAGWQGNTGGWTTEYGILSASAHPEEAWQFLKFLATDIADTLSGNVQGEGTGGATCYLPLAEDWAGDDPLRQDTLTLLNRLQPPPLTPDIWTSVNPFAEAWRRITEDGEDVTVAITEAAQECQEITDELWTEWEALSQ